MEWDIMSDRKFIVWRDNFLIGDENIDSEHIGLFNIAKKANEICSLENEQTQKELLKEVVKELDYYVNLHFANEEKFMTSINYPNIHEHKKEHKKMLEMLSFMSLNLDIISAKETNYNLYEFVQSVFVKHMISEDTKIIKYQNS